ncbi:ankyrin repeat-containing protein ITN1-like isoform X8 [Euphorbia lathyris]|uniref:ankyrin repeat-containing protein ITN1-like isoform X8 n=1 Tax=Euphorbia lathyris TaxID=212925 RepID=UPI003314493B
MTDKKGRTAFHMAVKGQSCDVVKFLLETDPAIVMPPDYFGNTTIHAATRKTRVEFPSCLLVILMLSNCDAAKNILQQAENKVSG